MYFSLFREPENYIKVVTTLGKKRTGMTREELIEEGNIIDNGKLTQILEDLEYCGFIRKYNFFGKKTKGAVFQLIDFYTLFYFKFILNNERCDKQFWSKNYGTPMFNTWSGLAFERVCLLHTNQIKHALSIRGIQSQDYAWYSDKNKKNKSYKHGAQIDLLIDRNDDVINLCEMKYYSKEVSVTEEEENLLINRIVRFQEESGTDKAIHVVLVTTKGLKKNSHSDIIRFVVTLPDLFEI